jgi:hypothetical protein
MSACWFRTDKPLNPRLTSRVSRLRESPWKELAGNEFRTSAVILVAACRIAYTALGYEHHVFAWHFLVHLSLRRFPGGFITEIA